MSLNRIILGIVILIFVASGIYYAFEFAGVGKLIDTVSFFACPADSCHELGTEIDNSCFIGDGFRTCEIVLNHPDRPRTIFENEFAYTVSGNDVECFIQTDGFGGSIDNPKLLCYDSGRYDKDIFIKTERSEGLSNFVRFTVIGDQTLEERVDQLCEEEGFCSTP